MLTRTLLIHALTAGGTDGGPRLVAFDKTTGEEIASVDLPGGAIGTPMTYMSGGAAVHRAGPSAAGRVPELIAPGAARRRSGRVTPTQLLGQATPTSPLALPIPLYTNRCTRLPSNVSVV